MNLLIQFILKVNPEYLSKRQLFHSRTNHYSNRKIYIYVSSHRKTKKLYKKLYLALILNFRIYENLVFCFKIGVN